MTHNHTCPTCRKGFTCDSDDCSDDDLCYECLQAERDRYEVALNEIANNHDCDPRAEAREALDPMSHK